MLSCKFVQLGIKWAKVKYNEGNFRVTVGLGMLWVSVRLTIKVYCGLNFKISIKIRMLWVTVGLAVKLGILWATIWLTVKLRML
jgi:hypothetical protein